jgi:predicted murein hydrolase (TIGR00659 family)
VNPAAAWEAALHSPLFGVTLTLVAYKLSRALWERLGHHPIANPVLLSVIGIGVLLWLLGVDYETYLRGASLVSLLLGPATVALALPLHRELPLVRRAAAPVLLGVALGSGAAVVVAYALTRALGASEALALSMAPKSATTPVSLALSAEIGGIAALSAVLTIIAGILGAVLGPQVLSWLRVRDPRVRGLAVGVASHGIGTARMLHESRTEGAFSALAMALTALATSVWVPLLLG